MRIFFCYPFSPVLLHGDPFPHIYHTCTGPVSLHSQSISISDIVRSTLEPMVQYGRRLVVKGQPRRLTLDAIQDLDLTIRGCWIDENPSVFWLEAVWIVDSQFCHLCRRTRCRSIILTVLLLSHHRGTGVSFRVRCLYVQYR